MTLNPVQHLQASASWSRRQGDLQASPPPLRAEAAPLRAGSTCHHSGREGGQDDGFLLAQTPWWSRKRRTVKPRGPARVGSSVKDGVRQGSRRSDTRWLRYGERHGQRGKQTESLDGDGLGLWVMPPAAELSLGLL